MTPYLSAPQNLLYFSLFSPSETSKIIGTCGFCGPSACPCRIVGQKTGFPTKNFENYKKNLIRDRGGYSSSLPKKTSHIGDQDKLGIFFVLSFWKYGCVMRTLLSCFVGNILMFCWNSQL